MSHAAPVARPVISRSPIAAPAAVAVLFAGLLLASYTVLIPALLGLALLGVSGRFLSARVNPFAVGFYLPTKPSWTAILVVALVGLLLLSAAYVDWRAGLAPLLPRVVP